MKSIQAVALAMCFLGALASPAYAYIDPGTGTIIVQAILGAFVAGSLFFRQLRDRFTSYFQRWRNKDKMDDK